MKEQEPNRTEQLRLFIVGEILSGRGQAPPLRSSAVPRFSHIQAGAAGALQRKPPPPESHR